MAYNPIQNFYVNPGYAKGHFIQWKLDPVFSESLPYNYTVEVSGTPNFSELYYTLPVGDSFFAVDTTRTVQSFVDDHYYRVKLTTGDKRTYYSKHILLGGSMATRRQWKMAAEITRKEILRMSRFTGSTSWLLKRKNFGLTTKATVDPVTGAAMADNVSDFGVGLSGGYYDPLYILMTYEDVQQDRHQDPRGLGVIETRTVDIRMIGYPAVEIHDVIADSDDDKRYIVTAQNPTFFPSTDIIVIQQLKASLIPNTDPIYDIDLNIGPTPND